MGDSSLTRLLQSSHRSWIADARPPLQEAHGIPRGRHGPLREHRFEYRVTYASVYGDCWVSDGARVERLPKVDLGFY